jgi:hypothetical protein
MDQKTLIDEATKVLGDSEEILAAGDKLVLHVLDAPS